MAPGGEDDLAVGVDTLHRAAPLKFNRDRAAAVEQDAVHQPP